MRLTMKLHLGRCPIYLISIISLFYYLYTGYLYSNYHCRTSLRFDWSQHASFGFDWLLNPCRN